MTDSKHNQRLESELAHLTAEFLSREANGLSLITVTGLELHTRGQRGTIKLSVYPSRAEAEALAFARRKRGELLEYLRGRLRARAIPRLDFVIDEGEKNRQRIDEIVNKDK